MTENPLFGPLKTGTLFLGTLGIGTALWYLVMTCIMVMFPPIKASIVTGTGSSE